MDRRAEVKDKYGSRRPDEYGSAYWARAFTIAFVVLGLAMMLFDRPAGVAILAWAAFAATPLVWSPSGSRSRSLALVRVLCGLSLVLATVAGWWARQVAQDIDLRVWVVVVVAVIISAGRLLASLQPGFSPGEAPGRRFRDDA